MRYKKKKGTLFIVSGLVMICAAFILTGYNAYQNEAAKKVSISIVKQLDSMNDLDMESDSTEMQIPLYEQYPDMAMPTVQLDSGTYIGVLKIPLLGLELPVMESWSYAKLQTAPCRYEGSVYKDNMIIAGHNYNSHFGKLQNIGRGELIEFEDIQGHVFTYEVVEKELIPGTGTEQMLDGDWDLSLFTCNYDGSNRVTIRCIRVM